MHPLDLSLPSMHPTRILFFLPGCCHEIVLAQPCLPAGRLASAESLKNVAKHRPITSDELGRIDVDIEVCAVEPLLRVVSKFVTEHSKKGKKNKEKETPAPARARPPSPPPETPNDRNKRRRKKKN